MLNHFTFNGQSTADFGLLVTALNPYTAPSRRIDKVQIPYRNGDLIIDSGVYNNIIVSYEISLINNTKDNCEAIRNWLLDSQGYHQLIDTINPETFRIGCYYESIEYTLTALYREGRATISFDCFPQRYLERNTPFNVDASIETTNGSTLFLETASAPLSITLKGNSDNSQTVTGTVYLRIYNKNLLSSDTYKTGSNLYVGNTGTGYNKHLSAGTYTFTKSSNKSIGTYCRERNDNANTQIMSGHNGTKSASITLAEGDYRFWFYASGGVSNSDVNYYQLEKGSTATTYEKSVSQFYTIRLGSLELRYGDTIIKENDKWYVYDGNTQTEITDADLISDLNALETAVSYKGQTNILQYVASGNLFNLTVKSLPEQYVPSSYNGEPIIQVQSAGMILFNGELIKVNQAPMTINSQTMQCYDGETNLNNSIEINDFPMIKKGQNEITSSMDLTIIPNYWEL